MKKLFIVLVVAAFAATSTFTVVAAEKPGTAEKEAKTRALPYQGKLTSVDAQAKTIKVGARIFHILPETKITKNGQPATIADAAVGEPVGVSYRQGEDKALNLVSLRIGPKPEVKKEEKQ